MSRMWICSLLGISLLACDANPEAERRGETQAAVQLAWLAATAYRQEEGAWPDEERWREQLTQPDGDAYIRATFPFTDGWKRPLRYNRREEQAVLYSVGPNGLDEHGEGDDITGESTLARK